MVSIDFFTVPTIRFQILYVFLVLVHDRRRILHFNVTAHPTVEWTGQQLREAFPFDQGPRYLLRDRDAIFGDNFREQVRDLGIREVLCAPHSPWQKAYIERVIGSIRRECLDHVIVFAEVLVLAPFDADKMRRFPVCTRINAVTNDDPDCVVPMSSSLPAQSALFG